MINDIVNNGFFATSPPPVNGSGASDVPTAAKASQGTTAQQPAKQAQPSAEQLNAAVSKLNDYVQNVQRSLSFSVDKDTGDTVVKVIDTETNELIRQIPSEDMLKLAAAIDKETANLFVKERA